MRVHLIHFGDACYTYQAATLCAECGEATRRILTQEGKAPLNPYDETTYDSGDYPKGPDSCNDESGPWACDRMDKCLSLPDLD